MASGSSFTWGSLIDPVGKTMKHYGIDPHLGIDMLVASFVLVLIAFFAGIKYRKNKMVEPSQNLSFSRVVEIAVAKLYFFSKGFLGERAPKFFFLIASLFFFILFNNLIGSIPGFNPPTDQINTTCRDSWVFLY